MPPEFLSSVLVPLLISYLSISVNWNYSYLHNVATTTIITTTTDIQVLTGQALVLGWVCIRAVVAVLFGSLRVIEAEVRHYGNIDTDSNSQANKHMHAARV